MRPYGKKRSSSSGSHATLKTILVCIAIWLLILFQYFLHTYKPVNQTISSSVDHLSDVRDKTEQLLLEITNSNINALVAILLQSSPVRGSRQISRLRAIDDGYATWTMNHGEQVHGRDSSVKIFAAVHNSSSYFSSNSKAFQNIQIIQTLGKNPFHKLVDAFMGVMTDEVERQWLVMGNDHSFFVPHNLQRYLRTLPYSSLIYGGNRLGVTFHQKLIFFASGGAGAIFSRGTVNGLLVLWSILHKDYYDELLGWYKLRMFSPLENDEKNLLSNHGSSL